MDSNQQKPEEQAVQEIQTTEQDRQQMKPGAVRTDAGEPGRTGEREDVDSDDSQMSQSSSHPLSLPKT